MATATDNIDAIKTIMKRQADDSRNRFREVARQYAGGGKTLTPPEEVASILDAAGKTADDLAAEIERIKHRGRLKVIVDQGDVAKVESAETSAHLSEVMDRLQKVEKEHQDEIEQLRYKLMGLRHTVEHADRMKAELLGGGDPKKLARLKKLEEQIESAFPDRLQAEERVDTLKRHATLPDVTDEMREQTGRPVGPHPFRLKAEKELPAAKAALDAISAKVAGWRVEIATITAELIAE